MLFTNCLPYDLVGSIFKLRMIFMQKKLSIMLPVYNMDSYIDECLKSLAKQDWDDVEVIIIDDDSTYASYEICRRYVNQYPYVKVFHEENGGVALARNTALRHASGEYFYWVDQMVISQTIFGKRLDLFRSRIMILFF